MKNSRAFRAGVLAVASLALFPILAAAQSISDSTFTDANWTLTQFPGGGGGSAVAGQASNGGNFYRTIADQVNTGGLILDTNIYNPFTYDPSVSGPIAAISYSEDVFCVAVLGAGAVDRSRADAGRLHLRFQRIPHHGPVGDLASHLGKRPDGGEFR